MHRRSLWRLTVTYDGGFVTFSSTVILPESSWRMIRFASLQVLKPPSSHDEQGWRWRRPPHSASGMPHSEECLSEGELRMTKKKMPGWNLSIVELQLHSQSSRSSVRDWTCRWVLNSPERFPLGVAISMNTRRPVRRFLRCVISPDKPHDMQEWVYAPNVVSTAISQR